MVDGLEDAVPLKPSITSGKGTPTPEGARPYWKSPTDKPTLDRITLLVEVGKERRATIAQTATHACRLFGASPMRDATCPIGVDVFLYSHPVFTPRRGHS